MSNGEAKHQPPADAHASFDAPADGQSGSPHGAKPPVTPGGALPKKAAEDDPRVWGDAESDTDRDAWLREQRPPHWD